MEQQQSLTEQQRQLTQALTRFVQQQDAATAPPAAGNGAQAKPQQTNRPDDSLRRRTVRTDRAEAKVSRAIDALMAWNDEPGRPHRDKLRIRLNSLKQLTRVRQDVIYRMLAERGDAIEEHHQRHGIGPNHRNQHRANECIPPEQ